MSDITIESIFTKKNIKASIYRYRKEKIDNICPFEYWKECGEDILNDIYTEQYRTMPMRCFFIKKASGKKRMITVPVSLDKILQRATAVSLERYYDSKFSECSFAFRKKRSKVDALEKCLLYLNNGYEYVIRIDIKNYFDAINRTILQEILLNGIEDGRVVSWIMRIVDTPVNLEGIPVRQKNGISQGSPLSPCLANIYLNEFDWYMDSYAINFVRYADDILIFCKDKAEASELLDICKIYLKKELMLEINVEKTIIDNACNIDFLGFAFLKEKEKYSVSVSNNTRKKLQCKIQDSFCRGSVSDVDFWEKIGAINRGWTNYYQLAEENNILPILTKLDEIEFRQLQRVASSIRNEILTHSNFTLSKVWYQEKRYQEGNRRT